MTISSSKEQYLTPDIVSSQWVWIDNVVSVLGEASGENSAYLGQLLLLNSIDQIRPLLLERSCVNTIYKSHDDSEDLTGLIKLRFGEDQNYRTDEWLKASHYSDIAFSLPALISWLKTRRLGFSIREWDKWMKEVYPVLKIRGLIEEAIATPSGVDVNKDIRCVSGALTFRDLQLLCGYQKCPDVIAWLANNGIPFTTGKRGQPLTTLDALNDSLGVTEEKLPDKRVISE